MTDDHMLESASPIGEAGQTIGSVAADLKAAATRMLDQGMMDVRSRAEDAKSAVADEVNDVAIALRHASEELRSGSAQERTLGQIATTLAGASDAMRDKGFGEILELVRKVGRDNPVLFLGGAALLGFAASRYAKASGSEHVQTAAARMAEQQARVEDFIDEGNPNTQPVRMTP
jgi:hypothetical protein